MEISLLIDLEYFRLCGWSAVTTGREEWGELQQRSQGHAGPRMAVSSCQRIELYHAANCACEPSISLSGRAALAHLAEVAAGLHSVILGEHEILGQVRAATATAPPALAPLAAVAIAAARELRESEALDANTGHLLDRALRLSGSSAAGTLAVVGAGATARAVAARGRAIGFDHVIVASRTQPEGEWFQLSGCSYVPLARMNTAAADVVVTGLGSGAAPLVEAQLPAARSLVVDLGTPRNTAGDFGVPLVDIAALWNSEFGRTHGDARRAALRARLGELLDRRMAMLSEDRTSAVGAVRQQVERIRRMELERSLRLHPDIPASALETITRSLVNQIFHLPSERLRTSADPALAHQFAALFAPSESTELTL